MDDVEASSVWLAGLARLNTVIVASGRPLVGNLCYDHLQADFAESPPNPVVRSKRDRFRSAVEHGTRMLEIGVNGGHSAYVALTMNPKLEFHGIDICEHPYVRPAVAHLQAEFPGRVFFHPGDCLKVLPRLASQGEQFDIFHIDGAKHTYLEDVLWCDRMVAKASAVVIMDDTDQKRVSRVWRICTMLGVIEEVPQYSVMSTSEGYRNQVGRLIPLPTWKRPVLRGVVTATAAAHGVRTKLRTVAGTRRNTRSSS